MSRLFSGALMMTAVFQLVQSLRMAGLTGPCVHNVPKSFAQELFRPPWSFYEGYIHKGFPLVLARGAVPLEHKQPQLSIQQPRTNSFVRNFGNSNPFGNTKTSGRSVGVKVQNLPLPVVANRPLPVRIKNTSLKFDVGKSVLPVGVVNRTLSVKVADLPLPVGIANQTLNVNVNNLPLRTTVDQPVEVTSNQLVANLTAIDADIKALKTLLEKKNTNARLCPTTVYYTQTYCFPSATSCICLVERTKTFADATAFCKEYGFDGLISLQTKSKASFVSDMFPFFYGHDAWTSGSDSGSSPGTFVWKTTGEAFTDTAWAPGEPTARSDSSCVQFFRNGTMKTESCNSNATAFFCERAQLV